MNYVLLSMKCRLTAIRLTSKSLAWLLSRSERLSESTTKLCIQLFHSMGVKDVSMQVIDIPHRVSAFKASSRPNPIIFKFFRRQVKWWQHRKRFEKSPRVSWLTVLKCHCHGLVFAITYLRLTKYSQPSQKRFNKPRSLNSAHIIAQLVKQ